MRNPLVVEVETKDGSVRNVILTQGSDIKNFFRIDDNISYFFDRDEATEPNDLLGQAVFGMMEHEEDIITKIRNAKEI
tara:strand:- start:5540 stop:5773 length:234 start_codon:yes stop_codon:yes gene_type:complete